MNKTDITKLGIIAGSGSLPTEIANHASAQGRAVYIVGIKGFAEQSLLEKYDHTVISIGEVGKQLAALKKAAVSEVCFAGIVKRPDFQQLKLDAKGLFLLPKVLKAASKGDDALLRVLVEVIENDGFKVVGADYVLKNLVAESGPLGKVTPSSNDIEDIKKAAHVAAAIGNMDIGQGAVVCDGLVLAVEAQEGTDLMLQRCAELPDNLRGSVESPRGVLVKRPKPSQERRIDLPTIGIQTLKGLVTANLAGVAFEENSALLLDREELIQFADTNNLWIYGFKSEDL